MLRCACVLRLRVLECLVATTLFLVSMISVRFLLRSYHFTEHVALNGCNVIVLNAAIIPRTMPTSMCRLLWMQLFLPLFE